MKRRKIKAWALLGMLAVWAALGAGCAAGAQNSQATPEPAGANGKAAGEKPSLPDKLQVNAEGVPVLRVYQVDEEETREMDLETYIQGVVAGEMKNDWPMEALKAQAILARTFVLKFCTEKSSKYENADISTDVEEAQAYDATAVNDRVEQAVRETRGLVLSFHGELPYAWFHAHSGGVTERAQEGLNWKQEEPGYTKVTQGRDSSQAPAEAREWQAAFSAEEMLAAAKKAGWTGSAPLSSVEIGKKSESGRAVTLLLNGQEVSAPELRLALGASAMRSTLLTELSFQAQTVTMRGTGYGHGVGMPQWGAYGMAEEGRSAEEIVRYYFDDVTVEALW